jgi:hypothetical protein
MDWVMTTTPLSSQVSNFFNLSPLISPDSHSSTCHLSSTGSDMCLANLSLSDKMIDAIRTACASQLDCALCEYLTISWAVRAKKYNICLFSVSLIVALRPLVRLSRPLPVHLHVAYLSRCATCDNLCPYASPGLLALVYLVRWLPSRSPWCKAQAVCLLREWKVNGHVVGKLCSGVQGHLSKLDDED